MQDKKRKATEFVERVGAGEKLAEGELIHFYGPGVLLMLEQRVQDQQLAVDLYQDTFIVVIERLRREPLNEPDKLGGFIYSTARNLLIGDIRKKTRRKTFADTDIVSESADSRLGPLQITDRDEEAKIVHMVISTMRSERDRNMLLRYYIDEVEKETICSELNLSNLHFNRVLFRARRRFRKLLVEYESSFENRVNL